MADRLFQGEKDVAKERYEEVRSDDNETTW